MDFHWTLLIVSSLVVVSGLLVIKIERLYLTEPLLAMLVGIAVSSLGFRIIGTSEGETQVRFLEVASQLTISLSLMAAAYKIPRNYLSSFGRSQAVILLLVMPLMFLFSGLIAYGVFSLPLAVAFLIAAVITPTDPVVSSTIVSGRFAEKLLPASLRHTLSFESAANDGLAYPLVLLMLFVLGYDEATTGANWLLRVVGWETLGAIGLGLATGYGFGCAMHAAHQRGWMNQKALLSFSVAFGFFVLSLGEVLQTNGIVAVFAAGLMVSRVVSKNEVLAEENVQETIERLFTIPIYFFFGMLAPIEAWLSLGGPLLLFAVLILLFRRLPALLLVRPLLPRFKHWPDLLFLGWFGPVGVAALFYSMHVLRHTPYQVVWEVSSFVVFFSTLVHGLTSLPLSKGYARRRI